MKPHAATRAMCERRRRADDRLAELSNVRATAYGVARTDGVLQPEPAYVVFVDRKRPKSKVRSADMIPRHVTRNGIKLRTDVEELGWPLLQTAIALNDKSQQSTATCFARRPDGVFAVSCAHGLLGKDGYAVTPDPVAVWRPQLKAWEQIGESNLLVRSGGSGISPDNFGFLDAGLVKVDAPWLQADIISRAALPIAAAVAPMLAVFGEGVVSGAHAAVVRAMWINGISGVNIRCDVIIEHPTLEPLTRPGDSGMLWLDADGRAVAMHVKGAGGSAGKPSLASLCTLASRLPAALNAELVL